MSTVLSSLINVTGPHVGVRRFCSDARRRVPAEDYLIAEVDLSFEKLFALHPSLESICGEPPWDSGHYVAIRERSIHWKGYLRARFTFEVKNYEVYKMIRPVSRFYPALCFVNSELCLDDGSISSYVAHRGRGRRWDLPEKRADAHWKRAARAHKIKDMDDAYDNDEVREEAELAMRKDGLAHWDEQVLRYLDRAAGKDRRTWKHK